MMSDPLQTFRDLAAFTAPTDEALARMSSLDWAGLASGIRKDAPPIILMLYQSLLAPINEALTDHTTIEELRHLRQVAAQQTDTPPAVLDVIDAYIRLYAAIERL